MSYGVRINSTAAHTQEKSLRDQIARVLLPRMRAADCGQPLPKNTGDHGTPARLPSLLPLSAGTDSVVTKTARHARKQPTSLRSAERYFTPPARLGTKVRCRLISENATMLFADRTALRPM